MDKIKVICHHTIKGFITFNKSYELIYIFANNNFIKIIDDKKNENVYNSNNFFFFYKGKRYKTCKEILKIQLKEIKIKNRPLVKVLCKNDYFISGEVKNLKDKCTWEVIKKRINIACNLEIFNSYREQLFNLGKKYNCEEIYFSTLNRTFDIYEDYSIETNDYGGCSEYYENMRRNGSPEFEDTSRYERKNSSYNLYFMAYDRF